MLNAQTYQEAVQIAGERIAKAAEGILDTEVPSCPGFNVSRLLAHTGEFCTWVANILDTNQPAAPTEPQVQPDPIDAHRRGHAALVGALEAADADAPSWTWSTGRDRKSFWFRRAAQELSMHAWDVTNAAGKPLPVEPTIAADGISEMLDTFGAPNILGYDTIAKTFDPDTDGTVVRLEATDTGDTWTFTRDAEIFNFDEREPQVTGRGTASDLLLFIWGRIGPETLDVTGDASLLDRWQERVKI